jgi:hypothetical protein
LWGSQSWLEAGFQPASLFRDEFLGLRCTMPARHETGEIPANCTSGRSSLDGGLKGRLQARLPAPPGFSTGGHERWPRAGPSGTRPSYAFTRPADRSESGRRVLTLVVAVCTPRQRRTASPPQDAILPRLRVGLRHRCCARAKEVGVRPWVAPNKNGGPAITPTSSR